MAGKCSVFVPLGTRREQTAGVLSLCFVKSPTVLATSATPRSRRPALVARTGAEAAGFSSFSRAAPPTPASSPVTAFTIASPHQVFPRLSPLSHRPPRHRYPLATRLWKLLWRRRSRRTSRATAHRCGHRALIRRMWTENPSGVRQIAGQMKLGHYVFREPSPKYSQRAASGSGQKWSPLPHHLSQTWAVDWFTIVTLRFQVLYASSSRPWDGVKSCGWSEGRHQARNTLAADLRRGGDATGTTQQTCASSSMIATRLYGTWFRRRKGFRHRCPPSPPRSPQPTVTASE